MLLEAEDRRRHEAKQEHDQSNKGQDFPAPVERRSIVDGGRAQEANGEEQRRPNIPAGPMAHVAENNQNRRENPGRNLVGARTERAENVTAIELCRRKKVQGGREETNPCGATDRGEKQHVGVDTGVKERIEQAKQQRRAKNHSLRSARMSKGRNEAGMQHAVNERGNREDKSDQRAGSTDIEECARRANRRANEDERSEGSDERGKRDEERIGGADVVAAASEEMAQFVSEKNNKKRYSEGQTRQKARRIFVQQREGTYEIVDGGSLLLGVGAGKLRARNEAGTEC